MTAGFRPDPSAAPPPATLARWAALFLILTVLADLLVLPASASRDRPSREAFDAAFAICAAIHVWVSLYDGGFPGWRKATWLLLIGTRLTAELVPFLGFVLPWGQTSFWLATQRVSLPLVGAAAEWLFRPESAGFREAVAATWVAAPLGLLGLDLACMQVEGWRRTSRPWSATLAILLLVAAAAALAAILADVGLARALPPPSPDPAEGFPIVPPAIVLPTYALLRAVPDKLGGAALVFAVMAAPVFWLWARADRLRAYGPRHLHLGLCALLALAWIALGILGARAPEDDIIFASRIAAGAVVAFFLAAPMLARFASRVRPAPSRSSPPAA